MRAVLVSAGRSQSKRVFCEFLNFENPSIQSKVILIFLKITLFDLPKAQKIVEPDF